MYGVCKTKYFEDINFHMDLNLRVHILTFRVDLILKILISICLFINHANILFLF